MFKNIGKLSAEDKKGGDYSPLKKGTYVLTVKEAVMGETEVRDWDNGGAPTGQMMPQLTVKLIVNKEDGSTEIENVMGVIMNNPVYTFWVNDDNLGWYKKKNEPKKGRAILSALLGVTPDGDISPAFEPGALEGRQLKGYMTVEVSKAGKERNVIMDPEKYEVKKK